MSPYVQQITPPSTSPIPKCFPFPGAEIKAAKTCSELDVLSFPVDRVFKFHLQLSQKALGPINVPIFAYRSSRPGPVVGVTCAIHGNEINGIPVIQKLFDDIDHAEARGESPQVTSGTLIAVPVLNVPGFLDSVRTFDGQDLNRLMPGKENGAASQQYAYRVFHGIVSKFDILLDLHTASAGRQNSMYVRADMTDASTRRLASLISPQVIVHNSSPGGSLRGSAQAIGIRALTIEIGHPSLFQSQLIERTYHGIWRVLRELRMTNVLPTNPMDGGDEIGDLAVAVQVAICSRSFWIFTENGGILQVYEKVADRLKPGELIADVRDIFGEVIESVFAPEGSQTVVVGLEANPVAKAGNRVVHLGVVGELLETNIDDGHM